MLLSLIISFMSHCTETSPVSRTLHSRESSCDFQVRAGLPVLITKWPTEGSADPCTDFLPRQVKMGDFAPRHFGWREELALGSQAFYICCCLTCFRLSDWLCQDLFSVFLHWWCKWMTRQDHSAGRLQSPRGLSSALCVLPCCLPCRPEPSLRPWVTGRLGAAWTSCRSTDQLDLSSNLSVWFHSGMRLWPVLGFQSKQWLQTFWGQGWVWHFDCLSGPNKAAFP